MTSNAQPKKVEQRYAEADGERGIDNGGSIDHLIETPGKVKEG